VVLFLATKPLTCAHINSSFSATDTKKVLYEKTKQKKIPVVYKTDKIANLHGHVFFY
jgi:hypothetical protein